MAEYLVKDTSLTAIADEIRELSGTTGAMGLDTMATHIGEANDNVGTEAYLITQIQNALEGKAAGGSSGTSIETCTVTVTNPDGHFVQSPVLAMYIAYENGGFVTRHKFMFFEEVCDEEGYFVTGSASFENVAKGTEILFTEYQGVLFDDLSLSGEGFENSGFDEYMLEMGYRLFRLKILSDANVVMYGA